MKFPFLFLSPPPLSLFYSVNRKKAMSAQKKEEEGITAERGGKREERRGIQNEYFILWYKMSHNDKILCLSAELSPCHYYFHPHDQGESYPYPISYPSLPFTISA